MCTYKPKQELISTPKEYEIKELLNRLDMFYTKNKDIMTKEERLCFIRTVNYIGLIDTLEQGIE